MLDQRLGWRPGAIRSLFEAHGLMLDGWEKARTDRIAVGLAPAMTAPLAS